MLYQDCVLAVYYSKDLATPFLPSMKTVLTLNLISTERIRDYCVLPTRKLGAENTVKRTKKVFEAKLFKTATVLGKTRLSPT